MAHPSKNRNNSGKNRGNRADSEGGQSGTGKTRELRPSVDVSEDFRQASPVKAPARDTATKYHIFDIDDAAKLKLLCGENNEYLTALEQDTGTEIDLREDGLSIFGTKDEINHTVGKLFARLATLSDTSGVTPEIFNQIVQQENAANENVAHIRTPLMKLETRRPNQAKFVRTVGGNDINFGIGPAGTGKTYLAVAMAVEALESGEVKNLILCRPAVEAGEKLGFLPGTQQQKVDPYMRPIYDALFDMLGEDVTKKYIEDGIIEISPLGLMRGRTLKDAFIIVDEVQNTTVEQMKMILTRFGDGSKMVLTGDITQNDLPIDQQTGVKQLSGLEDFVGMLETAEEMVEGIGVTKFDSFDVVRHPVVGRIVGLYEAREARRARELAVGNVIAIVDEKNKALATELAAQDQAAGTGNNPAKGPTPALN